MLAFSTEISRHSLKLLFALYVFLLSNTAIAQSEINSDRITEYVDQIKDSYKIPGVAVSITDLDSTVYLEHFGKIDPDEQLLIGSCSKSFTALLILKLQQKKLLDIDEPVVKYLSWFQYKNKDVSDKIVLRSLLQHTSGIPSILGRTIIEEDKNGSTQDRVEGLLKEIETDSIEHQYEYSNINYRLLGFIIEKVTGQEFGEVLREQILNPLDMETTTGFVMNKNSESFPRSYDYFLYYPVIPYVSEYYKDRVPAGYIASNASDMGKYLRELMKSYTNDSSLFIDQNSTNTLFKPNPKNAPYYGFGWFINNWQDTEVIYHTGLVEGFNTAMIILPEEEKAIFVAVNISELTAFEIAAGVFHILIDIEPSVFSKTNFYLERSIPFLVLFLLVILIKQFMNWKKSHFKIGFSKKFLPNFLLILGVVFGLLWVIAFPIIYNTSLAVIIDYDPVSGYSIIIIAIAIILITIIRYLNGKTVIPSVKDKAL